MNQVIPRPLSQADCVATTRCPRCGVPPGELCRNPPKHGLPGRSHRDRWLRYNQTRPFRLGDLDLKRAEQRAMRMWLRAHAALLTEEGL